MKKIPYQCNQSFLFGILLMGAFIFAPALSPAQAALSDLEITCETALFAGGTGSTETPWLISTPQQLANITFCTGSAHTDKYFQLTTDIDLANFESQFDGNGWMPIGYFVFDESYQYEVFYGHFDGNYKKIQNLTLSRDHDYQALFLETYTDSVIENVGLEDVDIVARTAAGIAGYVNGTIRTSYVSGGSITGTNNGPTGGIVSVLNGDGSITDSYLYDVTISGTDETTVGGIAGHIDTNATITRTYSNATISTNQSNFLGAVGGITGNGNNGGIMNDSFSVSSVSTVGDAFFEGTISGKWGETFEGGNNYWLIQDENPSDCIGAFTTNEEQCSSVEDANYFKDAGNEPLATWDINTTDDSGYETYRDGFPFLAWERDGADAETTWWVYGEGDAPETFITSSTAGSIDSTSATFEFTSNDEVATFECAIDEGSFTPCTSPFAVSELALGSHIFEVRAIGPSENVDMTPASVSWTIYATHPEIISTEPADGDVDVLTDTTVVFTFAESVPEGIRDNLVVGSGPCDEVCPSLEGDWSDDYRTLTYTNPDPYAENTEYTVTISVSDSLMETLYEVSFTTQESTRRRRSVSGIASPAYLVSLGIVLESTTPPAEPKSTTQSNDDTKLCPPETIITQNMRAGARNGVYHSYTKAVVKEVKLLQGHMNRLGFNAGTVDGILGPLTDGAIKRIQKFLGTYQDGMVGPITRGLINKSCGGEGLQN